MADLESKPEGSKDINPLDNLTGWIEKQDAEPADTGTEGVKVDKPASPAEPTVAQPAQPEPPAKVDWREVVLDDVDHGFFRGKKVPQLLESYRYAEAAKQQAERRAAEAERRLAELQQQPSRPAPSNDDEVKLLFEKPQEALQRVTERATAEAFRMADARFQEQWANQTRNAQIQDTFTKGSLAYDAARDELKVEPAVWDQRVPLVLMHLTNPQSPYFGDGQGITRTADYTKTYKALFGDPQPAPPPVVAKPTPEPPPPPGSKNAAKVTGSPELSPLDKETREAYRVAARHARIDPDEFVKVAEKRARR